MLRKLKPRIMSAVQARFAISESEIWTDKFERARNFRSRRQQQRIEIMKMASYSDQDIAFKCPVCYGKDPALLQHKN